MGEAVLILTNPHTRAVARQWIDRAPDFTRLTFKDSKRTLPQNDLLHAIITDVARQIEWAGAKRNVEAWKDIFTAALRSANNGLDVVPGINGGFVLLGMHTSAMSKDECGQLIELIYAFGAEHGVVFQDPEVPLSPPRDGAQGKPASGGGR